MASSPVASPVRVPLYVCDHSALDNAIFMKLHIDITFPDLSTAYIIYIKLNKADSHFTGALLIGSYIFRHISVNIDYILIYFRPKL
jgi:hypothetical protein